MQAKIFDFLIDGKSKAQLFGDFGTIKPYSIDGIAHAVDKSGNTILTLYSDTGIETPEGAICSADLRLNLSAEALMRLHLQLGELLGVKDLSIDKTKTEHDAIEQQKVTDELSFPL